jgi:Lipocalin-like domain
MRGYIALDRLIRGLDAIPKGAPIMMAMRVLAPIFALALGAGTAAAQPAKSLREQLVGTWSFIIAEISSADGKKTLPFGDKPKGMLIFTADGHFSQVHVSSGLPRIASNNRLAGTDADNRAIVQGTLALFGTYTVDEDKKTLTFHITASTFPNQEGVSQTRTIDTLTAEEFRNTNPGAARDGPASAVNIYKRAK